MTDFSTLAEISQNSYSESPNSQSVNGYKPFTQDFDLNFWNNGTGFTAHAYYSQTDNTMVVSFAGTAPGLDYLTDAQLSIAGTSNQDNLALRFSSDAAAELQRQYGVSDANVVYTGHSLGGYLAQVAGSQDPNASVIVYNAPGMGGIITDATPNQNATYIYSDPQTWSLLDRGIHTTGGIQSDDVFFLLGSEGHTMTSMMDAFQNGRLPISAEQWGAILAEGLRTGEISPNDLMLLINGKSDIVMETVIQSMFDSGTECFGAEASISMWPLDPEFAPDPSNPFKQYDQDAVRAKIWKKPIELIRVGDYVVSHDKNDNMVPGYVPRTMNNDAKILLNFHGTPVTPGHVYYRPDSKKSYKYETLIDVLRDDGMIEHRDGIKLRAATNVPVGDPRDGFVQAIAGKRNSDGTFEQTDEGRIRLGTRFLVGTGKERKSFAVADLIEHGGGIVGKDELIHIGDGPGVPFTWDTGDTLPKPEDFVLACSGTTLEDIYKAAEWESQGPSLAAPMVLDRGPVQPLKGAALSAMPRNEPLNVAHAPMAAAKAGVPPSGGPV